jgi:hypothetical protein
MGRAGSAAGGIGTNVLLIRADGRMLTRGGTATLVS